MNAVARLAAALSTHPGLVLLLGTDGAAEIAARALAADPDLAADIELGAAWREAEAALPEGWVIEGLSWERGKDGAPSQRFPDRWLARAYSWSPTSRRLYTSGEATPAEALRNLAAKLRERA